MFIIKLHIVQNVVCTVTDRCPFSHLLFRINNFISAVFQEEFGVNISGCSGNNIFCAQLTEQGSGFQRTLEIISNGHNTYVEIPYSKRFHKSFLCGVTNLCICNIRKNGIYSFFISVNSHYLMIKLIQFHCNMTSESSKSYQ